MDIAHLTQSLYLKLKILQVSEEEKPSRAIPYLTSTGLINIVWAGDETPLV